MPLITLILAGLVVAVDQIIKYFVSTYLQPIGSFEVIPNLFSLTYVENRGAAFGMLANSRWLFIAITIIVTVFLIIVVLKNKIHSKLFSASMILIIGGGIANLIDRIFLGYVVDYLSLSFFPPVCNFADYCICIGAALLVVYILFFSDKEKVIKNG